MGAAGKSCNLEVEIQLQGRQDDVPDHDDGTDATAGLAVPREAASRDVAKVPAVAHPIVRQHPESKRLGIFLGDHAESIEGMLYEAGRKLIEELNVAATSAHLVYTHTWQPGECIVWDNRCTLHRATGFDVVGDRRKMRRCTINGDRPTDGFFD